MIVEQGRVVNSLLQGVFRVVMVLVEQAEVALVLVVLVEPGMVQAVVMVTEVSWQEHIR